MKHEELWGKNIQFLNTKSPALCKLLNDKRDTFIIKPLPSDREDYSDFEVRSNDGEQLFNSIYLQCSEAFRQQISDLKRVLMQAIIAQAPNRSVVDILDGIVGSEELVTLNSLPCFVQRDQNNRLYSGSPLPPSSVLLGSCSLLYVDQLLGFDHVKTLLLVESDFQQLSIALHFVDLVDIISKCKNKGISFEMVLDQKFAGTPSRIPVILETMANKQPSSMLGYAMFRSPRLSPDMIQVESWMSSPDGFVELARGYLGNDTDEFNQVMHALYTALHNPTGLIMPSDLQERQDSAIIVASGPSLDQAVKHLSSWKERPVIFAAGSSVGSLLRNGIVPEFVVLLEQSWLVYHDLIQLVGEGYDLSEITLFGSATLDPRIFKLFKKSCVFHRPLSASLILFPKEEDAILPQAGPQAANAALEVSMKLGFREVLLLGCDFAAADVTKQRSVDAMGISPRNLSLPVPGSQGKTVYSSPELSVTKQLFEHIIQLYGAQAFAVGEGSRMNGVSTISMDDAITQFTCMNNSQDTTNSLLASMNHRSVDKASLIEILDQCASCCSSTTKDMLKEASSLSWDKTRFLEIVFPFISWKYRSVNTGYDLYARLTKFLYFFFLQVVVEDIEYQSDNKSVLASKSLSLVSQVYLSYLSFLRRLINMPLLPQWDPLVVKSMLIRESQVLSKAEL